MIIFENTPNRAGIILWGDYLDLDSLYEAIHRLFDETFGNEGVQNNILALAYDVRKAKELQREQKTFGYDEFDQVEYRGAPILWPILIFQINLLKQFAKPICAGKQELAHIYQLEACAEKALLEFDPVTGKQCIELMNKPIKVWLDYLSEIISEVTIDFLSEDDGEKRFKNLPKLLKRLYPASSYYRNFKQDIETAAKEHGCDPQIMRMNAEWPDFEW